MGWRHLCDIPSPPCQGSCCWVRGPKQGPRGPRSGEHGELTGHLSTKDWERVCHPMLAACRVTERHRQLTLAWRKSPAKTRELCLPFPSLPLPWAGSRKARKWREEVQKLPSRSERWGTEVVNGKQEALMGRDFSTLENRHCY